MIEKIEVEVKELDVNTNLVFQSFLIDFKLLGLDLSKECCLHLIVLN